MGQPSCLTLRSRWNARVPTTSASTAVSSIVPWTGSAIRARGSCARGRATRPPVARAGRSAGAGDGAVASISLRRYRTSSRPVARTASARAVRASWRTRSTSARAWWRRSTAPRLVLQREDAQHPGEVHALALGELLDEADPLDVAVGVPAGAAGGAGRLQQALALVGPQRLGVHTGQLRRDRDDVDRTVAHAHHVPTGAASRYGARYSARVAVVQRGVGLQRLALGLGQLPRHRQLDGDQQVAACPRPRSARRARAPAWSCRTACRPGSSGSPVRPGSEPSAGLPKAASGKVTGTVTVRWSPRRPNSGCGSTRTLTNRSPLGPP